MGEFNLISTAGVIFLLRFVSRKSHTQANAIRFVNFFFRTVTVQIQIHWRITIMDIIEWKQKKNLPIVS